MIARQLTTTLPDGTPVLVTLWPEGGGELAFKEGDGRWSRWGVPVELVEEQP
jgi:hypothetical protein